MTVTQPGASDPISKGHETGIGAVSGDDDDDDDDDNDNDELEMAIALSMADAPGGSA